MDGGVRANSLLKRIGGVMLRLRSTTRGGQHIFHRGTSALHLRGSMGECMFAIIKSAAVNMNTDQAVYLSIDNLYNYWKCAGMR